MMRIPLRLSPRSIGPKAFGHLELSAGCLRLLIVSIAFGLPPRGRDNAADKPIDAARDLRNGAVVPEDYSVVFCARGTSVSDRSAFGHAFVIWGKNDENLRACTSYAYGFFPEDEGDSAKSIFRDVPGTVTDSLLRNKPGSGECRLVVKLTKDQWEAAEKVRTEWKNKKYRLQKKDCVSFSIAVAEALRLTVPPREGYDNLPVNYVRKLVETNSNGQK